MRRGALAILGVVLACGCADAWAQSAPDAGRAFDVSPVPPAQYAVQEPAANRALQDHDVIAGDGAKIHVQIYLPAAKDGNVPPARVPVIAVPSPYNLEDVPRPDRNSGRSWIPFFVGRGYAVAAIHMRGTGKSDGCWDPTRASRPTTCRA
jgi:predicted acyl esterase